MTHQRNAGQLAVDDDGSSDIERAVNTANCAQIKNDSVSVDTLKPGDVVYAKQFMWAYTRSRKQLRAIDAHNVCIVLSVRMSNCKSNIGSSIDTDACKQGIVDVMLVTAGSWLPVWVRILDGAHAAVFTHSPYCKL